MPFKKLSVALFGITLAAIMVFSGCNEIYAPLSNEEVAYYMQNQNIRQCFMEYFNSNCVDDRDKILLSGEVEILDYYGKYNESYVALRLTYYAYPAEYNPDSYKTFKIDGINFGEYHYSNKFYFFNEAETDTEKSFLTLQDAYDVGVVTKDNLRQIAYYAKSR